MTGRKLPDLVADSRLVVELHENHTYYFNIRPDNSTGRYGRRTWRKETWTKTKRLGGGATGEVWLEECHTGEGKGQLQAVKVVPKSSSFDVYEELETIAKFSQGTSKYEGLFVKSLGWYENESSVFIVMEHMKHASLASQLTRPLPEEEAREITIQVLEGIACLHENEFVHRDLKPDNILVASIRPWWVKISDFGLSKRTSGDRSLHSFVGTQKYFAPEVLGLYLQWPDPAADEAGRYRCTYAMDLWSLGVTIFYMLSHDYPFQDRELFRYIKGGPFPDTRLAQHNTSQEACTFIKALLTVDPAKRLSAAAALKDPWLMEVRNEQPLQASEHLHSILRTPTAALPSASDASMSWPVGTWTSETARKELPLMSREAVSEPDNVIRPRLERIRDEDDSRATVALDEFRSLHEKGLQLVADNKHAQAELYFQQAAEGRKTLLGPYDKDTLESMQQLGVTYFLQSRHQDAQKTLQFTSDIQTESLGSSNTDTLTTNYWLSSLLLAQGKLDAAQEVTLGRQHEDTIKSLHLGGQIYFEREKYNDALMLFEQAAEATRSLGHAVMPESLRPRAYCLFRQDRYQEAQSVLELIVQASPPAPDLPQSLDLLSNIGDSLYQAGKYADAQCCFEKVLQARNGRPWSTHEQNLEASLRVASSLRQQQGKVHQSQAILRQLLREATAASTKQSILDHLHDTGETFCRERQYQAAYATFQEVVTERQVLLGRHHQSTLLSTSWLGLSLLVQKRYAEATHVLKAVTKDQQAPGFNPIQLAYTSLWLAQSLHYQGSRQDVHSYLLTSVAIFRLKLSSSHKDTITCLRCLGSSYGRLNDLPMAERSLREALELATSALGPTDTETIRAQISLGITLYRKKRYTQALEYLNLSADQQEAFQELQDDTYDTLYCVAATLDALKRYTESETRWRKVTDAREQFLGTAHPETQDAMRSLALCLAHQGKWDEAVTLHQQVFKVRQDTLGPKDAATIKSKKELNKCRKMSAGKSFIFMPERRPEDRPLDLDYRHL
ncbi:kinase-like domain-containing protein [Aspergillus californicus]